jgi:hypothetical protein
MNKLEPQTGTAFEMQKEPGWYSFQLVSRDLPGL